MLIKSTCLKKTFQYLLDVDNYNTLLIDKTALIIGILRKMQKWHISSIINEYRLFTGKNRSYFAETFLEIIELVVRQQRINDTTKDASSNNDNDNNNTDSALKDKDKNILPMEKNSKKKKKNSKTSSKGKSSNFTIINEDDLCKDPEVPKRLLKIIEDAEKEARLREKDDELSKEIPPAEMIRTTSNLGIFGHRYRLAFNKKENDDFRFYKNLNNANDDSKYAVTITIPKEPNLPEWFKFQRDLWEQEHSPEEHHFYKEHIFM